MLCTDPRQAMCDYCYDHGKGCPVLRRRAMPAKSIPEFKVEPLIVSPYQASRSILGRDAGMGRPRPMTQDFNRLPEEISPWLGMEPELAAKMAELFPAPRPEIVASRRLRKTEKWGRGGRGHSPMISLTIPNEVLYVTGMRARDLVLISGWAEGLIRIVRIPEGEDE